MVTQKFICVDSEGNEREVTEEEFQRACDRMIEALSPEERAELEARGAAFREAMKGYKYGKANNKGT